MNLNLKKKNKLYFNTFEHIGIDWFNDNLSRK